MRISKFLLHKAIMKSPENHPKCQSQEFRLTQVQGRLPGRRRSFSHTPGALATTRQLGSRSPLDQRVQYCWYNICVRPDRVRGQLSSGFVLVYWHVQNTCNAHCKYGAKSGRRGVFALSAFPNGNRGWAATLPKLLSECVWKSC